jgi:hypothetical protein
LAFVLLFENGEFFWGRDRSLRGVLSLALILLLKDASLITVVFNNELGSGVGDGELFGCPIDGVVLLLNHFDESKPLLSGLRATL